MIVTGHADDADGADLIAGGNGSNGMRHKYYSFLFIQKCQRVPIGCDEVHQHIGAHDGNVLFL